MIKSKKAETDIWAPNFPFLILFTIILAGTALFMVLIMNSHSSSASTVPKNMEIDVLLDRLLYSPLCFSEDLAKKESGQLSISLPKFTQEQLSKCFLGISASTYSFRLTLLSEKEKRIITTQNWKERRADSLIEKNVLIREDSKTYEGKLLIEVLNA